jgi:hypothetical protein
MVVHATGGQFRGRKRGSPMRREDVAMRAGIGMSWYTYLEQGRPIGISVRTLLWIATALKLTGQETRYVLELSGHWPGYDAYGDQRHVNVQNCGLSRILEGLRGTPTVICDTYLNYQVWNRAWTAVFGDPNMCMPERRNQLAYIFLEPSARLIENWDQECRAVIAHFRASLGAAIKADAAQALISRMRDASESFCELWDQYEVDYDFLGGRAIRHPTAGLLTFEHSMLLAASDASRRLLIFTPATAGTESDVLKLLETSRSD